MAWKQKVQPNLDPYILDGGVAINDWLGWCLGYVNAAFGVAPHAYTAWRSWGLAQKTHTDRNFPVNVYFPIWFSHYGSYNGVYQNWGHVAICYIRSDTGAVQIWSSPITHKPFADTWNSIGEVERNYSSTFVGWSEDINGTQLIESISDISPTQRVTATKCFAREQPNTNAASFQEIDANEPITMKGFVNNGEAVEGNTTWFVTARSGKYMSAQVFTDTGTHDLPDLTPKPPVVVPPAYEPKNPEMVDPTASDFPAWVRFEIREDSDDVTTVNKEAYDYYKAKYGQDYKYYPVESHVHWWGAPTAGATHDGVVSHLAGTTDLSVDFVVSAGRITKFGADGLQKVSFTTGARSMYAWTSENDPTLTEDVYRTMGLLHYVMEKKNPRLKGERIRLHKEFMKTECSDIDVAKVREYCTKFETGELDFNTGKPVEEPKPPVVVPPVTPPIEPPTDYMPFFAKIFNAIVEWVKKVLKK